LREPLILGAVKQRKGNLVDQLRQSKEAKYREQLTGCKL